MNDLVYKIILAVVLLLVIAGVGYYVGYDVGKDDMVFCTQDAMECPDGSFVGRVGPNCEFAACPGN